jgi:GntR family transcriptional regulator
MLFRINTGSESVPIFEQIMAQVVFGVASGALRAGELIPSIRELAEWLKVHPNTVAKAYLQLENEGLITARRGKGMEVTPDAPAACRRKRHDILRKRLGEALREALTAISADELRRVVDEEITRLVGERL